MSNNKTPLWACFLFPLVGLVADLFIIWFRGFLAIIWIIASLVFFIIPVSLIPAAVQDENDDLLKGYIVLSVVIPMLILGLATAN